MYVGVSGCASLRAGVYVFFPLISVYVCFRVCGDRDFEMRLVIANYLSDACSLFTHPIKL